MIVKPAEIGEAISLGVSVLVVMSLLVYLFVALFQRSDSPYLLVAAQARPAEELPEGGFVLPVTIYNRGERSLSHAVISISLPDGAREIELEYLPRQSSRDVYLPIKQPYAQREITTETLYYKLD